MTDAEKHEYDGYDNDEEHTVDPFNYYDYMDTYEIESFEAWDATDNVIKPLSQAFLVISIIIAIFSFLLLFTVFSAQIRKYSASWYLYHANMVTVLCISFTLPQIETDLHSSFGPCMFFTFTESTLKVVYVINIILMNVEMMATIFSPHQKWQSYQKIRFVISMNTTWITSILFSAFVIFFGHSEDTLVPVCFHVTRTATIVKMVFTNWLPCLVIIVQFITGICLFIRSKKNPELLGNVSEHPQCAKTLNEWFSIFVVWNTIFIAVELLAFEMHENFFDVPFWVDLILQMACFLLQISLPICCLIFKDVRDACKVTIVKMFGFIRTKRKLVQVSDTQVLSMDGSE